MQNLDCPVELPCRATRPTPRVLVAGGAPGERTRCAAELRRLHLEASAVATGDGIIAEAVQGNPGILILYLCRPGCTSDGIALTRRLRQDERARELPIILLTEAAEAGDEERSERAGADCALPKSWPVEVLAGEVRRVIAARRRRSFQRRSDDA